MGTYHRRCPTCCARPGEYCRTYRGFIRLEAHPSRRSEPINSTYTGVTGDVATAKEAS